MKPADRRRLLASLPDAKAGDLLKLGAELPAELRVAMARTVAELREVESSPPQAQPPQGGPAKVWTPERVAAARARREELRGNGVRDYAARTAQEFGVTGARLRRVLGAEGSTATDERPPRWAVKGRVHRVK